MGLAAPTRGLIQPDLVVLPNSRQHRKNLREQLQAGKAASKQAGEAPLEHTVIHGAGQECACTKFSVAPCLNTALQANPEPCTPRTNSETLTLPPLTPPSSLPLLPLPVPVTTPAPAATSCPCYHPCPCCHPNTCPRTWQKDWSCGMATTAKKPGCDLVMPPLCRSMRGETGSPLLRSASPCLQGMRGMKRCRWMGDAQGWCSDVGA